MGKKKGSKNKLAKMSEEERARYLQHRADIEEEARRRKQQLIALYMKNKLKREEAFSRLNLAKINQEWRSNLRLIKCQELRDEMLDVERHFQAALEQKNRIIRRLLGDLDEAEELYTTLQESHVENIAKLIGVHLKRLDFWKNQYLQQKDDILTEYRNDFKQYKAARNKSQKQLECVSYALEDIAASQECQAEEEFNEKLDIVRSEMTIKLEKITRSREDMLEQLWRSYQQVLDDYLRYTDGFNAEYSNLRERDELNTKLIRKHCNEIVRATDLITDLKIEADNAVEEHEFRVNYLESYRNQLNERYGALKCGLERVLRMDQGKFKHLVVTSENVLRTLRIVAKKGERLLQLASSCRRLETEREKVLPFGSDRPESDERSVSKRKDGDENDLKESVIELWFNFEKFWKRVNLVRIDSCCLQEERLTLERENGDLKAQIKEYLTKMTLETGTGGRAEDRMGNRPSSMKVEKVVHIDLDNGGNGDNLWSRRGNKKRPVTCIEGNLSNAIRGTNLMTGKTNAIRIRSIVNRW